MTDKRFSLKDKYFILTTYVFKLIKLNFKNYVKKQKATYEIAKRLFDDSLKYSSNSSIDENKQYCGNTLKWIPISPKITSQLSFTRKE